VFPRERRWRGVCVRKKER
jgi:hypothetical protein